MLRIVMMGPALTATCLYVEGGDSQVWKWIYISTLTFLIFKPVIFYVQRLPSVLILLPLIAQLGEEYLSDE